jgi:hypothetical protein
MTSGNSGAAPSRPSIPDADDRETQAPRINIVANVRTGDVLPRADFLRAGLASLAALAALGLAAAGCGGGCSYVCSSYTCTCTCNGQTSPGCGACPSHTPVCSSGEGVESDL